MGREREMERQRHTELGAGRSWAGDTEREGGELLWHGGPGDGQGLLTQAGLGIGTPSPSQLMSTWRGWEGRTGLSSTRQKGESTTSV